MALAGPQQSDRKHAPPQHLALLRRMRARAPCFSRSATLLCFSRQAGLTRPLGYFTFTLLNDGAPLSEAFDSNFIVSLRHPILWFQSFYNYKVRQHALKKHDEWRPDVMDLVGPCNAGSEYVTHTYQKGETHREGVCTNAARFHHYLSRLGFTDLTTPEELSLVNHGMTIHSLPKARLFLMEIGQLSIENQTKADTFVKDLQEYVGLENPLPPLLAHDKKQISEDVKDMFIDICDEQYALIRSILLETGREARLLAEERPGRCVLDESLSGVARWMGARSLFGQGGVRGEEMTRWVRLFFLIY